MKKMVTLLALVTFASTAWGEPGQTSGNMLKLRKRPTTDSVAIEAYPKGEKVDVIGRSEEGKWVKVKVASDGKVGYMAAAFVSLGEQSALPAPGEQGNSPMKGFHLKTADTPVEAKPSAEPSVGNRDRQEKIVSLVARGGEGETGVETKYEATLRELSAAQKEISSLKQEVKRLKTELATTEKTIDEYRRRLATMEQVADFRLMSLVEMKGEEVLFNGLGTVLMAENDGRVIFKVPAELADKARRLFSKVNRNFLDGAQVVYITIDRSQLSLETRKG